MVERYFYRVCNGLFALEKTEGIVSVYDCGGQNQSAIQKAITRASGGKHGHIDNLFISHYHHDHINGLMLLLGLFDVGRIILPMVPNLTRVLNYSSLRSIYYADFVLNPQDFISYVSPDTTVVQIGNEDKENYPGDDNVINLDGIKNNIVFKGDVAKFIQNDWQYVIYNRRIMTMAELAKFMGKLGLPVSATTDEIIKALQKTKAKNIKDSLARVFSKSEIENINDYSMVVWSGQTKTLDHGCLYTGDYNACSYMNNLKAVYRYLLPRSEIIQIPHHGSTYNFHPDICNPKAIHVISASSGPYNSRKIVDPSDVITQLSVLKYKEMDTRANDVLI